MSSRCAERISDPYSGTVAETLLRSKRSSGECCDCHREVSPDLKTAKIFFTTRREDSVDEVLAGLRKATGFIKRQVSSQLRLRYIPDLEFLYDATLEKVNHLESLLRQAAEKEREPLA